MGEVSYFVCFITLLLNLRLLYIHLRIQLRRPTDSSFKLQKPLEESTYIPPSHEQSHPRSTIGGGNSLGKDTGFPEPLSEDRNTTLPHPEADTSPNASIEAPDVDLARTNTRRSFLGRHSSHQKASSFHPKDLEKSGLYDSIEYADGSREERHQCEESGKGSSDGSSLDGSYEKGGRKFSDVERKKGILAKLGFS